MKIVLFLSFLFVGISLQLQQVKIGVIFFDDETDIENAFTMAVNRMNQRFYDLKIVPIIRYSPTEDDSIILQKLVCDLIANGVSAIFGPSSKAPSDIVALVANETGIPHISFDWSTEETPAERNGHMMTVNVAPSLSVLSKAYSDIIHSYGWRTYTIVYESDDALMKLQDVIQLHQIHESEVKIKKFSRGDDYRILWKNVRQTGERRIILDSPPDILQEVMSSAIEFDMTGQFNHFFLTDLDTHEAHLNELNNVNFKANVTSVRVEYNDLDYLETETLKPSLIFDSVQLFAIAIKNLLEFQPFFEPRMQCDRLRAGERWMLGKHLLKYMKKASEQDGTFITKSIQFNEYGERANFNLQVYRPLTHLVIAIWNPDGQIIATKEVRSTKLATNTDPQEDYSESRRHYRVATRRGEPYLMLKTPKENEILAGNQRYEGFAVDLIYKLSLELGFDYTIDVVEDNQYGSYNPETKEWNGIVRYLIDNKADIGICDLTITQSRRTAVDFTVPFMALGIKVLYYKPPPEPQDLFAFLEPFGLEVWVYMATATLIVSLLFVIISRVSHEEWENPHPCNPNPEELENKWELTNTTWLTLGSLMGQGCDILPRCGSMRLINGMWWFFALMMLNSYTANLAAFLTKSLLDDSIQGIEDLTAQNKIKFGTLSGGSTSSFFKESNETTYRLAWSKMVQAQPTVFTKDNKEGVEMVKKNRGDYAFLMETTSLDYNVERNCDLMEVGAQIGEKHYGIAVPYGADYRSNLSVGILKLSEKGEVWTLKNKWWKNHNVTCDTEESDEDGNKLSLGQVGGVFMVLAMGLATAFLMGFAEFIWNCQQVAVVEKITPWEAFKAEGLFALKFWIKRKPISTVNSTRSSLTSSSISSSGRSSFELNETSIDKK